MSSIILDIVQKSMDRGAWQATSPVQFSLVTQLRLTLCDPMDCSTPGFPVHPRACSNSCPLSWWRHPTISSFVIPVSSCPQYFPASWSFPVSQFFTSGGQSIGASISLRILEGGKRKYLSRYLPPFFCYKYFLILGQSCWTERNLLKIISLKTADM